MINTNCAIMSWNVRGLNSPAKRATVCEIADAHKPLVLCIQETKIDVWSPALVREIGGSRLDGCAVLPAIGTRGGAAILWDSSAISLVTHSIGCFSITGKVTLLHSRTEFWLTTVYGPADDARKEVFLREITAAAPPNGEPWLINGDYNIIYEACDKSNLNLNRRIMGRFRVAIDSAGLREIKCRNRRFTWSNERENPTFVAIDKFFCNTAWELLFPNHTLAAASTACSDHCPLLLANASAPRRRARFRFENFWPRLPRFQDTVARAWQRPVNHNCPFIRIKIKLRRTAADLKIWAKSFCSEAKLQFHLATEVVLRLDIAQEKRQLTASEFNLRKMLKLRIVGLAALERVRRRQASRITWLKAGDAKTAFFSGQSMFQKKKKFHS